VNTAGAKARRITFALQTLKGKCIMSKYQVIHESELKVVNEQRAVIVQIQDGKAPVLVISQLYPVDDGDSWGFCSPRVSGSVSFRLTMTAKQIGWLVTELEKAQAIVEKAEKAATKATTTKKATKKAATKKVTADEEDLELEISSSRTRRIRR
jgi:hypothetical protein